MTFYFERDRRSEVYSLMLEAYNRKGRLAFDVNLIWWRLSVTTNWRCPFGYREGSK